MIVAVDPTLGEATAVDGADATKVAATGGEVTADARGGRTTEHV